MFTGIIEEVGTIESVRRGGGSYRLTVGCTRVLGRDDACPTAVGDSIAVNGICLTVTDLTKTSFTADVMPETVGRTSLADAKPGSKVNLERAMPAYGRFGGHIVSGHIDGTGKITDIRKDGNAVWYTVAAGKDIAGLIVEKGSIAIDGISLTVASAEGNTFKVSIIPHTMEGTILPEKKAGSTVNLETDIIGKYIKKLASQEYGGSLGNDITDGGSLGNGITDDGSDIRKPISDKGLLELL